jgi:hypothetical protein
MEIEVLVIHRTNVKHDFLQYFSDSGILKKFISVKMIDPRGIEEKGEGAGAVRDAISLFWKDIYNSYMLGENERVPIIRHDVSKAMWQALARVLLKGYSQERYFPIQISPVFLSCCLFGEESVTPEMYFDSFLKYISTSEATLVEKVLSSNVSVSNEEVLDLLTTFDCKKLATSENFKDLIIEIAHKEIVQKPRYACDCWSEILLPLKSFITSIDVLFQIYDSLHPTAGKVCKLIKAEPQSPSENESLSHLKRWIKGLNINDLKHFLRISTGSDIILVDKISVSFTSSVGNCRSPVFHTCGAVIELPSTYNDFCEFREEWCSLMSHSDIDLALI